MYWRCKITFLPSSVSLDDISAVRLGRHSEGLRKHTEEQVEDRCFSIMFKGRRKNLDLIASSDEEAKQWVNSLKKIISNMNNLNRQQKTEQYPYHEPLWFRNSCCTLWYESQPIRGMQTEICGYIYSLHYIFSVGSSAAWGKQTRIKMISWVSQSSRTSCVWSTSRWMTTTQRRSSRWCPQSFLMIPKY